MQAIFARRSIRKYTGERIDRGKIEEVLKAGMAAPSAGNERPWHFVVLDNKEVLTKITLIHPYSQMLPEAGQAIIICGDLALQKFEGFWVQDCAAAAENMLLMATELGLGSVWLGVYPREERVKGMRNLLNLPEKIVPFCIISLGYPAETKAAADRFDQARVHWNQW